MTKREIVYLVHLLSPLKHARHYLGTTTDIARRMSEHLQGRGSAFLRAANAAGIRYEVVRTWSSGRAKERELKRQHNAPRLCPLCQKLAGGVTR